jgi:hypothetical protein
MYNVCALSDMLDCLPDHSVVQWMEARSEMKEEEAASSRRLKLHSTHSFSTLQPPPKRLLYYTGRAAELLSVEFECCVQCLCAAARTNNG